MLELIPHSVYNEPFFIKNIHIVQILIPSDITPKKLTEWWSRCYCLFAYLFAKGGNCFWAFLFFKWNTQYHTFTILAETFQRPQDLTWSCLLLLKLQTFLLCGINKKTAGFSQREMFRRMSLTHTHTRTPL